MRLLAAAIVALAILVFVEMARALTQRSSSGPHRVIAGLLCIHRYEGSWTADTGNGYFGGLQMDAAFERTYGREFVRAFGHANHWPRSLQLAVGAKGYLARGWQPWPVSSRLCGLR